MALPLAGRTALVTGASRSIGRAIALALAARGARIAVHYGRDADSAARTVADIRAAGGEAFALQAELADPGAIAAMFDAFDREADGLDILVNNAGIASQASTADTPEAEFDRLFAVNTKAVWLVTQHALKRLRDGGRIINLSTALTRAVLPNIAAYSATKGAVDVLTLHWAAEFGARGITVNAIAPGVIDTDINAGWLKAEEARAWVAGSQALGRIGEATDVADLAAFLAGPDSRWITGQVLDASGGWKL
jgi:3-oxoacyl-[acyl-carrier protein] reductase